MLRGKIGLSKPEVKNDRLCVKLSFTGRIYNLLVFKCFLAYLGSSVKTTIVGKEIPINSLFFNRDIQGK